MVERKSFKQYVMMKEGVVEKNLDDDGDPNAKAQKVDQEWKKAYVAIPKGFIPPKKMKPVIEAFLDSGEIELQSDTSKPVTMPKKPLFLVGGAVREFLKGKAIKKFRLATPATPEQTAHVLHHAGFKMADDGGNDKLKMTFNPDMPEKDDEPLMWRIGRADQKDNPISITAMVNGEEFDITTFHVGSKGDGDLDSADFVDNPVQDSSRRDFTVNSLYIELSKADGENNKLYDPTGEGYHHLMNKPSTISPVGKAEDRFREDKSRILRMIRYHCRFGKGDKFGGTPEKHREIMKAVDRFKSLKGVTSEKCKDEFLKGLLHPDTDVKCYVKILSSTGLVDKIFPGLDLNTNIPQEFMDRRDKPLALAWLLQNNDSEDIAEVLGDVRTSGDSEEMSGWNQQERNAVLYLLKLREFSPERLPQMMKDRKGTGLSAEQIRDWVDFFNVKDKNGKTRSGRPAWAKMIRQFADHEPSIRWGDIANVFPGAGEEDQEGIVGTLEIDKFMEKLGKKK